METKFQTSFIPKKPIAPTIGGGSMGVPSMTHHHSTSLFMSIAVLIFIISLGSVGGSFLLKSYLLSQQESYREELAVREKQFNSDLIEELKRQNVKIDIAEQLLRGHLAMSQIFDIIGRLTIENVRFLSLDVTIPQNQTEDLKVSLRGYGTSFSAVAFQSDVLGQLEQYGLRKIVKNPIISDPSLDQNGTVAFGFTASVDTSSLTYEKSISSSDDEETNP